LDEAELNDNLLQLKKVKRYLVARARILPQDPAPSQEGLLSKNLWRLTGTLEDRRMEL
jgi:hypothetical protein